MTHNSSLEAEIVAGLAARNQALATAESCTGGLVASRITDVPGASRVFWGSWVVYDNAAKEALGVPPSILLEKGAVSAETAAALADAALATWLRTPPSQARQPKSHVVLVTTGIAGPDGGTPEKPVGLCYLGLKSTDGVAGTRRIQAPLGSDRLACKEFFAEQALLWLKEIL